MRFGSKRPVFWATLAAMVCLFGVVSVRTQAGQAPQTSDTVFKQILVLKGMPVDTFFDAMGMFAASMGGDCTYCHSKDAVFNRDAFSVATPRIQRARQMIVMMRTLNNNNFGGALKVTCFTCHRGAYVPETAPRLALQYGTPDEDPNMMNFVPDTSVPADRIFDRYLQAIGGAGRLAKVSSFAASGTYSGFDTGFSEVPVEVFAKAPNQRTTILRSQYGDTTTTFDGKTGWIAAPPTDKPIPFYQITGQELQGANFETELMFPTRIKQALTNWRVGVPQLLGEREVLPVQGSTPGGGVVTLNFDSETGLLLRLVRYGDSPVGRLVTRVDYEDYRDVNGVKMPFNFTVRWLSGRSTFEMSEIQANVPVDAARFVRAAR